MQFLSDAEQADIQVLKLHKYEQYTVELNRYWIANIVIVTLQNSEAYTQPHELKAPKTKQYHHHQPITWTIWSENRINLTQWAEVTSCKLDAPHLISPNDHVKMMDDGRSQ